MVHKMSTNRLVAGPICSLHARHVIFCNNLQEFNRLRGLFWYCYWLSPWHGFLREALHLDRIRTHPVVECKKKVSSVDRAYSVIGTLLSVFVMISPVVRVTKKFDEEDNAVTKYRWFMSFLALLALDYAVWVGYSLRGCYCEVAVFMIINSMFGLTFTCLWALMGLFRARGCIAYQEDKMMLAGCFASVGAAFGIKSYYSNGGYYALAGALVAHFCRFMGTDYTQFSGLQFIVSIVGVISGFMCIRHPHLVAAQPFWQSTAVIATFRGLECLWWILLVGPKLRRWLQDVRGAFAQVG